MASVIEAVRGRKIYNYGADAGPAVDESAPQNSVTRKGKIRVEMERRLERASQAGAKALVVRAGDFYGPRTGNNWLAQGMVPSSGPVKRVFNPGRRGVEHAWAYLTDLAETMVRLLEGTDDLAHFDSFQFGGIWVGDNRDFADATRRAAGNPTHRSTHFLGRLSTRLRRSTRPPARCVK